MRIFRYFLLLALVFQLASVSGGALAGAGNPGSQGNPGSYGYTGIVTDFTHSCYGAAVSPLVFVTTASCFEKDGQAVKVAFESKVTPPQKPELRSGHWYAHPDFCPGCPAGPQESNAPDVGVVIFDEPLPLTEFASLPAEGALAGLKKGSKLTLVGYRLDALEMNNGLLKASFERGTAGVTLTGAGPAKDSPYFRISATPAKNGACINGPGAPVFLGSSRQLLGVVAGPPQDYCHGNSYVTDVTSALARQFIQEAIDNPYSMKPRHD